MRKAVPTRSGFGWTWTRGTVTLPELGDPLTTTAFALCLYDDGALAMQAAIEPGGVCGTKNCWKALRGKGFAYRNRFGNADGITAFQIRTGTGKARINIKGKGAGADETMPSLPLSHAADVTVQVIKNAGDGPECWAASLPAPARKNDSLRFTAAAR